MKQPTSRRAFPHALQRLLLPATLLFLVTLVPLTASDPAQAMPNEPQACSGLFFSEYIEGSSYNKAVEIFNGTGAPVDLSAFTLELYSNGSATPNQSTALSGSVADGDVLVVAHASAAAAILAEADATNSSVINFNGDDAVVLKQSGTVIDVIGQVGYDPGSQWGSDPTSTADNTLRRQASVSSGDSNANDTFDPANEWLGFAKDTFNGLGSHVAGCAGGEIAPYVTSTTPANSTSGVAVDVNVVVTFNEAVNVSGAWFQIDCPSGLRGIAETSVSGGPTTWTIDPTSDFAEAETCTATIYATQVSDQDTEDPPDLMTADYTWNFSTVGAPPPCSTIPQIQGTGAHSTCLGSRSDIEGCITGFAANGFYYQDVTGDGNPATSDGLFVYRYSECLSCENWQVGNIVSVSGNVVEFFDITEFEMTNTVSLMDGDTDCGGEGLPLRATVMPNTDPSADPITLYEQYESMRAQMSFAGWVTGATRRYQSRYPAGDPEIVYVDFASSIPDYDRVFEADYPGYQGLSYLSGGLGYDLPDLDFGDDLSGTNVTGIFAYNYDKYTLLVDAPPALSTVDNADVSSNEVALDPAKMEFDVCNFNVENLFDHINDGAGDWGDWAPGWPDSGTLTGQAEYQAKLDELAPIFVDKMKSCMVVGVEEVEGKQQIYDDLAAAVSTQDPGHSWTAGYVESGDGRDISQGFLWREDVTMLSITPVNGTPYSTWVTDSMLDFRRVMPHGVFRFYAGTTDQIDIHFYATHFKSKRSSTSCTTPDCTDVREKEAADMRDILGHHQAVGEHAIGGGDFNDVFGSSPIAILDASSDIYNLFYDLAPDQRWSYIGAFHFALVPGNN